MGFGAYSHDAHVAMTQARVASPRAEVFPKRQCDELMNPLGVKFRESRDSEAHPRSLGVVFALDVSGSMGRIPRRLATETLPAFMRALLDAGVTDPQVLFMAVGCAKSDAAPLQVGQFESTERLMDRWLTSMYLERGGRGGNESYELAIYFAARHTDMDCFRKRGKRGYLFITGDERPNRAVSYEHVARLIGDTLQQDVPIAEIIEEASRSFELFFLIPDPGRAQRTAGAWRELLGGRVIVMESLDDTSHVAAGLVSIVEGAMPSLDALGDRFLEAGLAQERVAAVTRAIAPFASTRGQGTARTT